MFLRDLLRSIVLTPKAAVAAASGLPPAPGVWPLDRGLVELAPGDVLTIRDCVSGIQIFGSSGSGKTSGSLALLSKAMLRDGWGMLVLTTKPREAEQWVQWANMCGRGEHVLCIKPDAGHHFNFLNYLNEHPDRGAAVATNIGDMLMTLAKQARPKAGESEASQFFAESASYMVTQAIHLLRAAKEPLTLDAIGKVLNTAPGHPLELEEDTFNNRFIAQLLNRGYANGSDQMERLCEYWLSQYPGMNERTRGDVIATLTSVIFRFTEPPFRDLIASSKGNSYIPELVDAGKVMILDCPVINYQQAGRLFQIAIKHLTQQAVLRRVPSDTTRPVAIIADEAQNFATHADYAYQAICRDFRGCTVYATQTMDNYLEAVGSEPAVEALLASLVTKIFHANAGRTNNWAEKLIAGDWRAMSSESLNQRGEQGQPNFGTSQSEQIQPQVLASEFTRLRTGGQRNGGMVDAIVFQPGRLFRQSGKPILRVTFAQGQ
jgi:hypothetical protein